MMIQKCPENEAGKHSFELSSVWQSNKERKCMWCGFVDERPVDTETPIDEQVKQNMFPDGWVVKITKVVKGQVYSQQILLSKEQFGDNVGEIKKYVTFLIEELNLLTQKTKWKD